jgi:hypothetical protein
MALFREDALLPDIEERHLAAIFQHRANVCG